MGCLSFHFVSLMSVTYRGEKAWVLIASCPNKPCQNEERGISNLTACHNLLEDQEGLDNPDDSCVMHYPGEDYFSPALAEDPFSHPESGSCKEHRGKLCWQCSWLRQLHKLDKSKTQHILVA